MFTIAKREFKSLFLSPLAWVIMGVMQTIFGWSFAVLIFNFIQPEVQAHLANDPSAPGLTTMIVGSLFDWIAIVLLLITPLLTMRLVSEERRNKTLALLISAPVSMTEIILGKFLGLMGFFMILLIMLALMPLSLLFGGNIDFGQLTTALLGLILWLGALTALGLYISTLTAYPTVAAFSTFGAFLLLWMIGWAQDVAVLQYLSFTEHYQSLLKGLINSTDIVYYLLFIVLFLSLSIYRLDAERL
jgi:ABC-2 type transport system permease protein